MADQSTGEKTEKATPQKLRKSRQQGQVARSRDLSTAIGIIVCLQLLVTLTPGYLEDFRLLLRQGFADLTGEGALDNVWSNAFTASILLFVKMVAPLAVIPLCIALGSLVSGGWTFSGQNLKPKFERLNPLSYFTRTFGPKHLVQVLTTILKAAALGAVLYHISRGGIAQFVHLQSLPLDQAMLKGTGLMLDGIMALCTIFVIFALIDVPVQRIIYLRGQRMSKRDVKEEYKTTEGKPEVRQRIRQLQHQMARRNIHKTVPTADLVVVNPEHYAVALKYDESRAEAPFVVAKGVDEMALYIRHIAQLNGVEVVTLAPLARAIYNTSQVQQQIPAALYKAVAQVLTYVLQLKAFRNGRRGSVPRLPLDLGVPPHLT